MMASDLYHEQSGSGGATHSRLRLRWQGTDAPVLIPDDPTLIWALAETQGGWPVVACPSPPEHPFLARLTGNGHGTYALTSRHLDQPMIGLGLAAAICGINADLIEAYLASRPELSGLHAGGAMIGDRLIALTGEAASGKSTLIARLSAEPDMMIFCDDILPVAPDGTATALGLATRLRLPLPETATQDFHNHANRYKGPADEQYAYVLAPTHAPHGKTAPLSAIVALDRKPSGPAHLEWLDPGELTRLMLLQNVAINRDSAEALARAEALIGTRPALRLVYSDLEDAVVILRQAFGQPDLLPETLDIVPSRPLIQKSLVREVPVDPGQVWQRTDDVQLQTRGSAGFLVRADSPTVWTLDQTALAVWLMLEQPGNAQDMAAAMVEVFPDEPPRRLTRDIARLLAGLLAEGLIQRSTGTI